MAQLTIPGGQRKGTPLEQAETSDIEYWFKRITGDLDNPDKAKYRQSNQRWLAGARAILDQRKGGQGPAPRATGAQALVPAGGQQQSAIVLPNSIDAVLGTFSDPAQITTKMQQAMQMAHLITPQTVVGALPPGFGIALSVVWVDVDNETYGIPSKDADKRGLDKIALAKIAAAAGVDWDPELSRRMDNHSHPHYCHWKAVAYVKNFDGSVRTEPGNVEIDLRDGSEEAAKASEKELPIQRKFIMRNAESKAMNRAIRRLGVQTSYTREQLRSKPFVVCRLMYTGQSDDPEIRKMLAEKAFDNHHRSRTALYGAPTARALPQHTAHAPPPVGSVAPDDDAIPTDGEDYDVGDLSAIDVQGTSVPAASDQAQPAAASSSSAQPGQQQTLPGAGEKY